MPSHFAHTSSWSRMIGWTATPYAARSSSRTRAERTRIPAPPAAVRSDHRPAIRADRRGAGRAARTPHDHPGVRRRARAAVRVQPPRVRVAPARADQPAALDVCRRGASYLDRRRERDARWICDRRALPRLGVGRRRRSGSCRRDQGQRDLRPRGLGNWTFRQRRQGDELPGAVARPARRDRA